MASGTGRDMRLDFFRGLALVTIFVNHVPGNVLEGLTSRNFGFSDAAEAFVLMSGIAAGLAYSRGLLSGAFVAAASKVWLRSLKLYAVHISITLAAVIVLMTGLHLFGEMTVFKNVNASAVVTDPLQTMLGIFVLGHQLGYFNILPLYICLLAAAPFMIRLGSRRVFPLLTVSIALWAAVGLLRINIPNYPNSGGWFLNPLSWQLVFAIGLLVGIHAKRGKALVPFNRTLFAASIAYLIYGLIIVQSGRWDYAVLQGLPTFLGGFDKSYLSLQRLLHVLALAYVLTNIRAFSTVAASAAAAPLTYLGRNSLSVFATGSVVCIALQVVRSIHPTSAVGDLLLIASGLGVQYLAAAAGKYRLDPLSSRGSATA